MRDKFENRDIQMFFEAVLGLKNTEECKDFFGDVCTFNEIKSIAQRLLVAAMLAEKKTYVEISDATGASTATISRVSRALSGDSGGLRAAVQKLTAEK
jgi:TrpR-related protein YerC/YecD